MPCKMYLLRYTNYMRLVCIPAIAPPMLNIAYTLSWRDVKVIPPNRKVSFTADLKK